MIKIYLFFAYYCLAKAEEFWTRLGDRNFKYSTGWLNRFKEQHGISFRKVCGELKSVTVDSDEMSEWSIKLKCIIHDYDPSDIFNADETVA